MKPSAKNKIFYLIILSLLVGMLVTILYHKNNKSNKIPAISISQIDKTGEVVLDKYFMAGPFYADSLNHNVLQKYGISESNFMRKDIQKFNKLTYRSLTHKLFTGKTIELPLGHFDPAWHFQSYEYVDSTIIYLQTAINCKNEQEVYLANWGVNCMKVWVNDSIIIENTKEWPYGRWPYESYGKNILQLRLKKGNNIITIKAFYIGERVLKMAILNRKEASSELKKALNIYGSIINPIISDEDSCLLVDKDVTNFGIHNITIKDYEDKVFYSKISTKILQTSQGIPINSLPRNKLYSLEYFIDSESHKEFFYVGDICSAYKDYERIAIGHYVSEKTKMNLEALLYRYNELVKRYKKDDIHIHRKLVFVVSELQRNLKLIETKNNPFKDVGGFNLHGYISNIDNQVRHYFVMAPDSIKPGKKYKLGVNVKPGMFNNHHFLISVRMARYQEHAVAKYLANKYDMIFLFASQRLYTDERYFPPLVESEIFNSIEDVKRYYTIDVDNICAFGACAGGKRALYFAENYPNYFNGVALQGLAYNPNNNNPQWLDIKYRLENLNNMHIYAEGDILDKHAPFSYAKPIFDEVEIQNENFVPSITTYNRHFYYKLLTENFAREMASWKRIEKPEKVHLKSWKRKTNQINWIHDIVMDTEKDYFEIEGEIIGSSIKVKGENIKSFKIKIKDSPIKKYSEKIKLLYNGENFNYAYHEELDEIHAILNNKVSKDHYPFSKNSYVEGPVWEVFSGPLAFVRGHGNTTNWISNCDSMLHTWNSYYYCDVKAYGDTISEEILRNKNVILFGNEKNNKILERIVKDIPLKCNNDWIELNGNRYVGKNVCYQFCYPNPFNPKKYILVIGSNDMKKFDHLQKMPWYYGIEDFYIWKITNGTPQILEKGNFDSNWKF